MSERVEKNESEQKAALAAIADHIKAAKHALNEAARIADENGVSFSWDGPDDSWGFGGHYEPKGWNDSHCSGNFDDEGWQSSSSSC